MLPDGLSTTAPPGPWDLEQVALLSRSVRIVGMADTPGLGCHTIAMEGFAGGRRAWVVAWLQ